MNNRTEKIYGALDSLCDALDLGRSESSTERLFLVLAEAFNEANAQEMETIRETSHDEGLYLDMRGEMADRIRVALAKYEARSTPQFQKKSELE
jgi:transcriptional regulator of acetoin/glycerol metabolism